MSEWALIDEEIERALRPLTPPRTVFTREVQARIARREAAGSGAVTPAGGRGWMVKAAAWLPLGLMESSALAKGAGAGTAAKGGAALGMFAVVGALLGAAASLAALLTFGRLKVRRARRAADRPDRLSDRMNYAEDDRWIGGILLAAGLLVYLFFFETMERTLLLSAAATFGATLFTLLTLDHAGRATRETLVSGFYAYFGQMPLYLWMATSRVESHGLSVVLVASLFVLFLGSLYLGIRMQSTGPFDWLSNLSTPLILAFSLGHLVVDSSLEEQGTGTLRWLSAGWMGLAESSLLMACVASVLLVLWTVRDAPEEIFAGPQP